MVLMGQGGAKQGHDAVAHDLVDGAVITVDGLDHSCQHWIEQLARLLRVSISQQLHRTLEVGEEDRDLLALAFQRALGAEDLLRYWLGSVRGRRGETPPGGHRPG